MINLAYEGFDETYDLEGSAKVIQRFETVSPTTASVRHLTNGSRRKQGIRRRPNIPV